MSKPCKDCGHDVSEKIIRTCWTENWASAEDHKANYAHKGLCCDCYEQTWGITKKSLRRR